MKPRPVKAAEAGVVRAAMRQQGPWSRRYAQMLVNGGPDRVGALAYATGALWLARHARKGARRAK